MNIDKKSRIFIIEGIPGAGKTTFHDRLKNKLKDKLVYDFTEEELLFGWKHVWIKDVEKIRLKFMNRILDYCEKIIKEIKNSVFILNRFHITFYILTIIMNKKISREYEHLIKRIEKLPVHIYVPILGPNQIEERASHHERKEKIWKLHLQKRLETAGFSKIKDLYVWEQGMMLRLLKEQKIPYSILRLSKKIKL